MSLKDIQSYLKIDPSTELCFNYVSRKYLSTNLSLTNITESPIAFKVKTNVPICYLVKPHMGVIPPKTSVDIGITMQPTDYNPQTAAISDKFLVNAVILPSDTNMSSLSDPATLQKAWDVPKNQILAHKLKVTLIFDSANQSATTPKSASLISPGTPASRESLEGAKTPLERESLNRQSSTLSQKEEPLMMSFGSKLQSSGSALNISKETQKEGEYVRTSQVQTIEKPKVEEKEQKKSSLQTQKEAGTAPKKSVKFESDQEIVSNVAELSKEELVNQNKMLSQRYNDLSLRSEEQRKMLFDLSEENSRLKSELANLKTSAFGGKVAKKEGHTDSSTYQTWQMLLVAIIALVFGAWLRS